MKALFRTALTGLLLMAASGALFAQQVGTVCPGPNTQTGGPLLVWNGNSLLGCPASSLVWTALLVTPNSIGGAQLVSSSAVGNNPVQVCHATYNFAVDGGGAPGLITPASNCVLPINSIIFNEIIDWTTAGTGATNTTTIGTTGTGGGAAILQASTAVASLTGIVQGVIVPQTASGFKKLTTAGAVTLTTATAALTAGVCEIYVFYVVSPT